MNNKWSTLKNEHNTAVANLRKEQEAVVFERNRQIQQYQQMQGDLSNQVQVAQQEIQNLRNRPRKY